VKRFGLKFFLDFWTFYWTLCRFIIHWKVDTSAMKLPLDHVEGEFERRDPERDPLDDSRAGRTTMSASPQCPPLELESDRLRLLSCVGRWQMLSGFL